MIEGRIENLANRIGIVCHVLDLYFAQFIVPERTCSSAGSVEVPTGLLAAQIVLCAVVVDIRECHATEQLLRVGWHVLEMEHQLAARIVAVGFAHSVAYYFVGERLRKFENAIDGLIIGPTQRAVEYAHRVIVQLFVVELQHILILVVIVEVENHTRVLPFGVGEAIQSRSLRRRDLSFDAVALEKHGIVARRCTLLLMTEFRSKRAAIFSAFLAHMRQIGRAGERHQQKIGKVGATRTTQARLGKAIDGLVFIVVARASIPTMVARVGPRLNHTMRNNGCRVRMAVSARTYKRIDIGSQVACLAHRCTTQSGSQKG